MPPPLDDQSGVQKNSRGVFFGEGEGGTMFEPEDFQKGGSDFEGQTFWGTSDPQKTGPAEARTGHLGVCAFFPENFFLRDVFF